MLPFPDRFADHSRRLPVQTQPPPFGTAAFCLFPIRKGVRPFSWRKRAVFAP